ncbi:MAG TPA: hypothetical protein VKF81_13380 [Blastocatellia bacterium]|nr:hypothetical protein [Blastocatellia bacterium]
MNSAHFDDSKSSSREGGRLELISETDSTQAILKAEGSAVSVKLANKDGKQQLIKP